MWRWDRDKALWLNPSDEEKDDVVMKEEDKVKDMEIEDN